MESKKYSQKITNNRKTTTFGDDNDYNKPIMYHEAKKKQQERDVALIAIPCTPKLHKPRFFYWDTTASSTNEQGLVCLLLDLGGEKTALSESRQAFELAAAQTSGLVFLFLIVKLAFEYKHPFINKLMVMTEHVVPSTRLIEIFRF